MASLVLTSVTKSFSAIDSGTLPAVDFDGGAWADITGCELLNIPDGAYYTLNQYCIITGANTSTGWRVVDKDTLEVLYTSPVLLVAGKIETCGVLQNNTGAVRNVKTQLNLGGATTCKALEDRFSACYADKRNSTDENQKMSVTSISFMGLTDGIFGKVSQQELSTALSLNAIPNNGLVWSGNSGNVLYSWDGVAIGVSV